MDIDLAYFWSVKTREMFERAVYGYLGALKFIPNRLKTQEKCKRSAKKTILLAGIAPIQYKTLQICKRAYSW